MSARPFLNRPNPIWPNPVWPFGRNIFDPAAVDTRPWRRAIYLLIVTAILAAPYGAAMGSWHSGRLAFYSAIKLPMLLIATWMLVFPFGWTLSRIAGWVGGTGPLAAASAETIFGTGLALAALTPVNLLFTHTGPQRGNVDLIEYHALYLTHLSLVAICGLIASARLGRLLIASTDSGRLVYCGWVLVFAFVAGQTSWVLRPFIGNPLGHATLFRRDAFDGNAYEMIYSSVLPRLFSTH